MATASLPRVESPQTPASPGVSWRAAVVAGLLALPALPLLVLHGRQLWLREHYQFFPLALVGAAALAYSRSRGMGPLRPGQRGVSYLLLGVAWGLLALAGVLFSPWIGAVAALVLIAAVVYTVGGTALAWRLLPAWAFLWLVIPPPLNLDQRLITTLQMRTAHWSSRVLDLVGVYHVMQGNVVSVPHKRLMVEEACSGINSLFAMLACTLFFVLWTRRPVVRATLLLLAAVGWVLLANVLRVVTIGYMHTRWAVNLGEGWPHEILGWVLFSLMLLLIWSTDRLLLFLIPGGWFRRRDPLAEASRAGAAAEPEPTCFPAFGTLALAAWPVAAAFGLLGVAQLALCLPTGGSSLSEAALVQRLDKVSFEVLPARFGPWELVKTETEHRDRGNQIGEYSRMWRYRWGRRNAIVSLDYAFAGWHELSYCYKAQGWKVDQRVVQEDEGADPFIEMRVQKPLEQQGYVLFGLLDEHDRPLRQTDDRPLPGRLSDRLAALRGLGRTVGEGGVRPDGVEVPSYQVQLFVETYTPLTSAEEQQAQAFFRQVWNTFRHGGTKPEEEQP